MTKPIISICTFVYNREKLIRDTADSVLKQLPENCEFVIVDDGSTDNTPEYGQELAKQQNVQYQWAPNQGRPFARNRCLDIAQGEYIVWIGSDDRLTPKIIFNYLELLKEHDRQFDIITGDIIISDHNLTPIRRQETPRWICNPDKLVSGMIHGNRFSDGGTLISRKLYDQYGAYDTDFRVAQDYEWFSRICGKAKIAHCGAPIQIWREHNQGRAADKDMRPYDAEIAARIIQREGLMRSVPEAKWGQIPDPLASAVACITLGSRFLQLADALRSLRFFTRAATLGKGTELAIQAMELLEASKQLMESGAAITPITENPTDPLTN